MARFLWPIGGQINKAPLYSNGILVHFLEYITTIELLLIFLVLESSRRNVMTGDLPEDFLRLSPAMNQAPQSTGRGQMVPVQPVTYYQPTGLMQPYQQLPMGRLSVTVQQVCRIFIQWIISKCKCMLGKTLRAEKRDCDINNETTR